MKKSLSIILVIAIILTGLFALPIVFAESRTFANEAVTSNVSNSLPLLDDYMSLDSPELVSSDGNILVSSNGTELYANVDGVAKHYGDIITDIFVGYTISQLEIVGTDILMIISSINGNKLLHADISSNIEVNEPYFSDNSVEIIPSKISSDGDSFIILSNVNILYTCTIDDTTLDSSNSTKITLNSNWIGTISTSEGNTYTEYNSAIYKIAGTEGVNSIVFTTNKDIIDFHIDGDIIYYSTNDDYIASYNLVTSADEVSELLPNVDGIDSISMTGDKLHVTSGTQGRILVLNPTTLKAVDFYGDKGSEIDRLNTPTDVAYSDEFIYVADSLNNRIIIHDTTDNSISEIALKSYSPTLVAKTNSKIYFVSNNALYQIIDTDINAVSGVTEIIDIAIHNEGLVVLTSTKVIIIDNNNNVTTTIPNITNASNIEVPLGTNMLYIIPNAANTQILKYSLENGSIIDEYTSPVPTSIHNFDYMGNLFLTDNDSIDKYTFNSGSSSYVKSEVSITTESVSGNISSIININNGDMYIASKDNHLLYSIDSSYISSISIENTDHNAPTDWDIIKVATVTTDNATALTIPTNPETSRKLTLGESVLILADVDDYYYVTYQSTTLREYILKTDLSAPIDNIDMDRAEMSAFNRTAVYKYPYTHAPEICEILAMQSVTTLYRVALWDWYKIEIITESGTVTGYVQSAMIDNVTPTSPPDSAVFLKTKSQNLGKKIIMYSEPSLEAEVMFNDIDDGIDIQLYGKFDEASTFTKVFHNEEVGYILSVNLQESGLTPNQIIAISISSACIIAFTLMTLLLLLLKKNRKKKLDNEFNEEL